MGKQYYIEFFDGIELKRFCELCTLKYDYIRQILKDPKRTFTEKQEEALLDGIDRFLKAKTDLRAKAPELKNFS
ncbi:MAG: hypothetical protein J6O88_05820 [Chryseobacterium sp.]|uniref:hypothetical protein n=1 Tax=Chryseobacterium sp. TaxID=1871047 RepID=UPI001B228E15|nr:hypothetical protein [Chryseobacterium sp.]MBO6184200.1 hypothetical protein [Chryseobacterium sp.]